MVAVVGTSVLSDHRSSTVIGTRWLDASDMFGRSRLNDPNDFVSLEIQAGLNRKIPVIPALVDGAKPVKSVLGVAASE